MKHKKFIYVFIVSLFTPLAFASADNITGSYKYAWSDQVGYINFAPTNGGITVTDSALSGYAWSENTGYINFAPNQGGVLNDGNGNLSGSAWGEGLGYIDFDNVSINTSTGRFSGTATGDLVGTLTFDCPNYCDVRTDWRPTAPIEAPGSVGLGFVSSVLKTLPIANNLILFPVFPALNQTSAPRITSVRIQPASTGFLLPAKSSSSKVNTSVKPTTSISAVRKFSHAIFSSFSKVFNTIKFHSLNFWQKLLSLFIF